MSPNYKRYDLGQQPAGTVVEVVLSCINNIRLMDNDNFALYAESKNCRYIGGRTEKSPARLTIPRAGHWHVVVDKTGFQTLANSNVRAIPPKAIQPANAAAPRKAASPATAEAS
ncbi:DUF1883 domain-containing protein [Hoeflea sp. AS16]|uniref:DUF1883 domain-containing protein n=1 Tax=unclassified Hoeflea TaxID=2614931 RepID=UPI00317949CD